MWRIIHLARAFDSLSYIEGYLDYLPPSLGRDPPAVEVYPALRQTVVSGRGALFHCRPTAGNPEPKMTWMRSDRRPMPQDVEILNGGVMRRVGGDGSGFTVLSD